MIFEYSWIQYKRVVSTGKLQFIHIIILIPGMGFFIYFMKDDLVSISTSWLSHIIFFIFLLQTLMIVGKRLNNEFFFSTKNYTIFPQKGINIFLFSLFFGIIDLNIIIYFVVSVGMILFVVNWVWLVKITFVIIFLLCEITYLIFMMFIIEFMIAKYGNSKYLFMLTFFPFLFLEQFTRFSEKFYLFDIYPISGWIGSTALSAINGDLNQVFLYFGSTIILACIGMYLLKKISFPRKNNVF
jgi:hypothetical protein